MNIKKNSAVRTGVAFLVLVAFISTAGAAGTASDQTEFKKGIQLTYKPQDPIGLGVYEIKFMPECDGVLTITTNTDRLDIQTSCKPRNLYIQFLVPSGTAVYQPKTALRGAYYQRILQKRLFITEDERHTLILARPENTGHFIFRNDNDDDITIEDVADQSIRANIKMIDAETIRKKDIEIYESLQKVNLTEIDNRMYSNLQKRSTNLGLDGIENKIFILIRDINDILRRILIGAD